MNSYTHNDLIKRYKNLVNRIILFHNYLIILGSLNIFL
jgi:hypothetical protein